MEPLCPRCGAPGGAARASLRPIGWAALCLAGAGWGPSLLVRVSGGRAAWTELPVALLAPAFVFALLFWREAAGARTHRTCFRCRHRWIPSSPVRDRR